jgi:hypothetical protein
MKHSDAHSLVSDAKEICAHISGRRNPGLVGVYPLHLLNKLKAGVGANPDSFRRPKIWALLSIALALQ